MNKIILVAYLNIKNIPIAEVQDALEGVANSLKGLGVKPIVVPIREGETRVECINPQLVSEEKYKEAEAMVDKATEALNNFIDKTKNGTLI